MIEESAIPRAKHPESLSTDVLSDEIQRKHGDASVLQHQIDCKVSGRGPNTNVERRGRRAEMTPTPPPDEWIPLIVVDDRNREQLPTIETPAEIALPGHEDELSLEQTRGFDSDRRVDRTKREDEVEPVAAESLREILRGTVKHADTGGRMGGGEAGHEACEALTREAEEKPDPYRPAHGLLLVRDLVHDTSEGPLVLPELRMEYLPGTCQHHLLAGPIEELLAERCLEPGERLADRRWSPPQGAPRPGDPSLFHDGKENMKLVQINEIEPHLSQP